MMVRNNGGIFAAWSAAGVGILTAIILWPWLAPAKLKKIMVALLCLGGAFLLCPDMALASNRYDAIITAQAKRTNIPASLIKAVIKHESSFRRKARSHKGALGLMQLMPATAKRFGVKNRTNAKQNIMGGTSYLAWLYKRYRDWRLVLAAYNAGEGAVDKYKGIPPYRETQNYVRKVLTSWYQYSGGQTPITIHQPQFDTPPPAQTLSLSHTETDGRYQLFEAALKADAVVEWQPPTHYYIQ